MMLRHSEAFLRKHHNYINILCHDTIDTCGSSLFEFYVRKDKFYLSCSSVRTHCAKIGAGRSEGVADVLLEQ